MRLGTVAEIGQGRELALEVPGPGPWIVFVGSVDPGKGIAPEVDVVAAVPGGGYIGVTRAISPRSGGAISIPGPGRIVVRDPAVSYLYRITIAVSPWHPPRWGLDPKVSVLAPGQQIQIDPPAYASRGRLTLLSGSLSAPAISAGSLEIPPMSLSVEGGQSGASVAIDWEGWI